MRDLFDANYYLKTNPDVANVYRKRKGKFDLLDHFMKYGHRENRSPSLYFNPDNVR